MEVDCLLSVLRSVDTAGDASANGDGGGITRTGDPLGGPTAAADGGGIFTIVVTAFVLSGTVTAAGLCVLDTAANIREFVLETALVGFDAATVTVGFDTS